MPNDAEQSLNGQSYHLPRFRRRPLQSKRALFPIISVSFFLSLCSNRCVQRAMPKVIFVHPIHWTIRAPSHISSAIFLFRFFNLLFSSLCCVIKKSKWKRGKVQAAKSARRLRFGYVCILCMGGRRSVYRNPNLIMPNNTMGNWKKTLRRVGRCYLRHAPATKLQAYMFLGRTMNEMKSARVCVCVCACHVYDASQRTTTFRRYISS